MKTITNTLKNNLRVITVDTGAFPSATVMLLVGAGSRYENKKNNGIAHFFEHMAFKGSKKYPDAFAISSTIDNLGGNFNAFTSNDHTGYYVKAPVAHFEKVVDLLADMIQTPKLKQSDIEREKGVIVEEINMGKDNPAREVFDEYEKLVYKGNPLEMPTIGYKETVTKFTRKTFTDYMDELYKPSNIICVVAGGLSQSGQPDEYFQKIISDNLGNWKDKKTINFESYKSNQKTTDVIINKKKTEQIHFVLGFRTFSFFDKRRHTLSVLTAILGKGMSSRLFTEVREKRGLCYYIHSYTDLYADTGSMFTHAGVRSDMVQVQEAIRAILKEHVSITRGNVTDVEIKKAKELLKGGLLLSLEDTFHVAQYFGRGLLLEKEIKNPNDLIASIEAVNRNEIIDLAKQIFVSENLNLAFIGNIRKQDVLPTINF
ncbi:hypothetical protein A2690_03195 [Candidatus Roizmanbacteria bacterium RIFCSPHIGHO2_01_FULL_39_12b]|uniref:Peptidase M16 n=1 Tax=Candidatus Roizmanbacteria bacterium RIFCSPHIGHO2_01_FULL_39_12b TaxID=1802030 RepID=A0A1F7GBC9_9BACT|nr:MAG: hypothetical protein A2690_03195 [Candidatus Roizmanbacteria bacterium RIFCSPHIGHO2_01_FULL_39_12b]